MKIQMSKHFKDITGNTLKISKIHDDALKFLTEIINAAENKNLITFKTHDQDTYNIDVKNKTITYPETENIKQKEQRKRTGFRMLLRAYHINKRSIEWPASHYVDTLSESDRIIRNKIWDELIDMREAALLQQKSKINEV